MNWIVLLQLGTPDSLEEKALSEYLRKFLMDPKTISIPWIFRFLLVNGIIIPRRLKKVLIRYSQIWDADKGSPLRYYGNSLAEKLEDTLPDDTKVFQAMRFGSPSIESIIVKAKNEQVEKITFVPLFPHETEATTGSIKEEVNRVINKIVQRPEIEWMPVFYTDEGYIEIMAGFLRKNNFSSFNKIVFSFHGLPMKHIEKAHQGKTCDELGCSNLLTDSNVKCYTRVCFQTARDIAQMVGLKNDNYVVSFQSRFGKRWIGPQTEDILSDLAEQGESVLVMAPSFMTDCLETSWEVGIYFKELFEEGSSAKFGWTPALNDDPAWVKHLHKLISD